MQENKPVNISFDKKEQKSTRPWGSYEILCKGPGYQTKRLIINQVVDSLFKHINIGMKNGLLLEEPLELRLEIKFLKLAEGNLLVCQEQ